MNYKIQIIRTEKNTDFEEQLKKWEDDQRWNRPREFTDRPSENIATNVLNCELTEEQFKKIKAEVFKTFE